jgi:hypothetical protein
MNESVQKCLLMLKGTDLSSNQKLDLSSNQKLDLSSNQILDLSNQSIKTSPIDKAPTCDDTVIPGKYGILSELYSKYPLIMTIILILHILISVCALVLAWECNRMTNPIMRLISTVIATIFSEVYIIYYAIYHIIMGFQCYIQSAVVSQSASTSVSLPPL